MPVKIVIIKNYVNKSENINEKNVDECDGDYKDTEDTGDRDDNNESSYEDNCDDSDNDDDCVCKLDKSRIKVVIVKGNGNKSYTMRTPEIELHKVIDEPIDLPDTLDLRTFYYNNQYYWLERQTGYLFLPSFKVDPVGKIINFTTNVVQSDSSYQLADKKIIWYYQRRVV